jgi:DnaJ-domain-containing protein 1
MHKPPGQHKHRGQPDRPKSSAQLPYTLYAAIEEEISRNAAGISEYALIRALRARGFFTFLPAPPAAPHQLFRAHFLLFHALYVLRDKLRAARRGELTIAALCIRLDAWQPGDSVLAAHDPLAAYYLDWANLEGTTQEDVNELIASFWKRFSSLDNRSAALAELGLEDPVSDEVIKRAWRRLAMEHHPDRGGDKQRLQAINSAVDHLLSGRRSRD